MRVLSSLSLTTVLAFLSLGSLATAAVPDKAGRAAQKAAYNNKNQLSHEQQQHQHQRKTAVKAHNVVDRTFTNRMGGLQTRIIGGSMVKNPYPFFALLEVGCGATLIHDDMLLSAAHCDIGNIFLRKTWIGGIEPETGLERNVVRTVSHPSYNDFTIEYDYMIMKLNTTALLDPYYQQPFDAVGLPLAQSKQAKQTANTTSDLLVTGLNPIAYNRDPNVPAEGIPLKIIGFGLTDTNGFGLADNLYENTVFAIDDVDCGDAYSGLGYTPEIMMCAGHPRGGADTCQGDSGGPMIDPESNTIVGVTSWGEGCGLQDFPGVYAQVDAVASWIEQEICENSCYPPASCDPDVLHPCASAVQVGGGVVVLEGPVEFTIEVTLDAYPSEFGAILTHYDSDTELWYVPYNSWEDEESPIGNLLVIDETFTDLPAGVYHLMIGDKAYDGVCCSYGEGGITITNSAGSEIWSDNGRYRDFEEVYFNLTETGDVVWVANNPDGTIDDGWGEDDDGVGGFGDDGWGDDGWGDDSTGGDDIWGSWVEDFDPSVSDPEWPGAYPVPVGSTNVVTLNIKTDRFPDETEWEWSARTGPDTFETVDSGSPLQSERLFTYEKAVESETIYRFTVTDSLSDGTCCAFGTGWFTITNANATDDNPDGTVLWKATGDEFEGLLEAYVWVDADGNAQMAEYLPGQGYAIIIYDIVAEERIIVVPEATKGASKPKRFGGPF